jgi:hypothetical protein
MPAALLAYAVLRGECSITQGFSSLPDIVRRSFDIVGLNVDTLQLNAPTRVWSESKPSLHLACALEAVLRASPNRYREPDGLVTFWCLMEDPAWIEPAIQKSASALALLQCEFAPWPTPWFALTTKN